MSIHSLGATCLILSIDLYLSVFAGSEFGVWIAVVAQTQGLWGMGVVTPWPVGSPFPDWGSHPRPLHGKAESQPLERQGRPPLFGS